jgi:3-hydroxy-3-methylglutaryl CoA synthase
LPGAVAFIKSLNLDKQLENRCELNIKEFDKIARLNSSQAENPNFTTDLSSPSGWYDKNYKDKGKLILKGVKDYLRQYDWS